MPLRVCCNALITFAWLLLLSGGMCLAAPLTPIGALGGPCTAVAVKDHIAYVGVGHSMAAVDVTNPAKPILTKFADLPAEVTDVAIQDQRVYVTAGTAGLRIFSLTIPTSPTLLGSFDTTGTATRLAVSNTTAFIADQEGGLVILDIGNPAAPRRLAHSPVPGAVIDVVTSASTAYVLGITSNPNPASQSSWQWYRQQLGITDPAHPILQSNITGNTETFPHGLTIAGQQLWFLSQFSPYYLSIGMEEETANLRGIGATAGALITLKTKNFYIYQKPYGGFYQIQNCLDVYVPDSYGRYRLSKELILSGSDARRLFSDGARAYIAAGDSGLQIVSLADPAHPALLGTWSLPQQSAAVALAGTLACVADTSNGLHLIDIAKPEAPQPRSTVPLSARALDVATSGGFAYLANAERGLQIVDLNRPANPLRGNCATSGTARSVALAGRKAFLAAGNGGFQAFDIANPDHPGLIGYFHTPGFAHALALSGSRAAVACDLHGLLILNLADPAHPGQFALLPGLGCIVDVAWSGRYAYLAARDQGLLVVDLANPAKPVLAATVSFGGYAWSVAVSGKRAYVGAA